MWQPHSHAVLYVQPHKKAVEEELKEYRKDFKEFNRL